MCDDDADLDGRALAVETYVTERSGRWTVEIVVLFPDVAVRRTVNDYPTKRHAEIAAGWMKRAADRDVASPSIASPPFDRPPPEGPDNG